MILEFTAPCNVCPFRRESAPGWLGPWRADDLLKSLAIEPFPCHQTIPEGYMANVPPGTDPFDDDRLQGCAGAAIFLNNKFERSRCGVTSQHQDMVKSISERIKESVFSRAEEFIAHHAWSIRDDGGELGREGVERAIAEGLVKPLNVVDVVAPGEDGDLFTHADRVEAAIRVGQEHWATRESERSLYSMEHVKVNQHYIPYLEVECDSCGFSEEFEADDFDSTARAIRIGMEHLAASDSGCPPCSVSNVKVNQHCFSYLEVKCGLCGFSAQFEANDVDWIGAEALAEGHFRLKHTEPEPTYETQTDVKVIELLEVYCEICGFSVDHGLDVDPDTRKGLEQVARIHWEQNHKQERADATC